MKTYLAIITLISMISCNSQSLNDKLREAILKNIDGDAKKKQYKTDSLVVIKVDTLTQSKVNLLLMISCDEKIKSNSLNAEMAVNEIKLLELSLENKIINGIDKKSRDNGIKEIREKLDDYGKYEKIAVFYSNKINTLSKLKSDSTTFLGFAVRSKWVYTTNDNVQENLELFHLVTKDFKIMSTPQVEFIEEP